MDDIERGIGDWKEGNLNELLNQLNQAKASIEGFVETSENKKEELLSEMLKTIEDKENEIYSRIDKNINERLSYIENKLSNIDDKINNEIEQNGVVTGYPRIFAGPQTIKGGKPDPDVYARHPHTSG